MNREDECRARRDAVLCAVETLYAQHGRPLKIVEIAEHVGISRTATHRYAVWLWANGHVDRTQDMRHGSIVPAGMGGLW